MKEHGHSAPSGITLVQLESAIEAFVDLAHLAGLEPNDLLALLDSGLDFKEVLAVIAANRSSQIQ